MTSRHWRHRRYGLIAFPNDPDGLRLELLRERPPLAFGHDTLLPHFRAIWGVHQIGAASTGATIRHGGDSAYYSPRLDIIQMPQPEAFRDAESYSATKAHELTHRPD